jgi:hypothetical protein
MASIMDFLKNLGGGIQNNLNQSHGGVGNFVGGIAQGIQDKFTGVTPQQRWQMSEQQRQFEEEQIRKDREQTFREKQQADLERTRFEQNMDRDEDRAIRISGQQGVQARHEETLAERAAAADLLHERSTQATEESQAFEVEDREDRQSFEAEQNRLKRENEFEKRQAKEEAANSYKPSKKPEDFRYPPGLEGFEEAALSDEEMWEKYAEFVERDKESHKKLKEFLANDGDLSQATISNIHRDQEVDDAKDEEERPGASQEEQDEARERRLAAIADFERFNEGRAGFSAHGSGEALVGSSAGSSSSAPALIEQDVTPADKQVNSRQEVAQFSQLLDQVAQGDPAAAEQLGEITSPGKARGFRQLEEEYGPEVIQQLRRLYKEKLGIDPPF